MEYISILEIENPNRVKPKQKKVTAINTDDGKPQLSRREREELEKQKAKAHYQKLHAAGKTEEARADLARLAIIRKQREEAAKKREEEKKGKFMSFFRLNELPFLHTLLCEWKNAEFTES